MKFSALALASVLVLLAGSVAIAAPPSLDHDNTLGSGHAPDFREQTQLRELFKQRAGTMNEFAATAFYNNRPVFLKCMRNFDTYTREVKALTAIKQIASATATPPEGIKHIVEIVHNFSTPNKYHCVMTHRLRGTYLDNLVRQANPNERDAIAREVFRQVLQGIQALHEAGYAHGDLKGDNIVVSLKVVEDVAKQQEPGVLKYRGLMVKPNVVIIDLGMASQWRIHERLPHFGAEQFRAPELLNYKKELPMPDMRYADVWALGVTLYEMLEKKYPFPQQPSTLETAKTITDDIPEHFVDTSQWTVPLPMKYWNRAVEEMVRETLRLDAAARPLPDQLLKHSRWLSENAEIGTHPSPLARSLVGPPLLNT
ncbi:kinase-like domain-containing protein [Thamnocephalis sphaerospora]|uniref:Kinase-like domain-containing protein n=1 Tax=Thamnocephalis sphaerospora TaxID=78915 RepID=A0A4P9XJX0_9FUNG|nr:kinase-like domain-containing protein [Thamnocephalis sphaerospora]|eukprot:RKP05500.1 kinase-like domain-containing protein [Thamnocephalis sphaerospora]